MPPTPAGCLPAAFLKQQRQQDRWGPPAESRLHRCACLCVAKCLCARVHMRVRVFSIKACFTSVLVSARCWPGSWRQLAAPGVSAGAGCSSGAGRFQGLR